ncbi:pilus assembly protein N-terminal domain-containing protein, partial [bacterium]|nr:pilus assembly protein N-terminal domain-containing protein [bacterium]
MLFKKNHLFLPLILFFLAFKAVASNFLSMAEGDAKSFSTTEEIGSVFVSDPKVADYQVIDKHKVVVFHKVYSIYVEPETQRCCFTDDRE